MIDMNLFNDRRTKAFIYPKKTNRIVSTYTLCLITLNICFVHRGELSSSAYSLQFSKLVYYCEVTNELPLFARSLWNYS